MATSVVVSVLTAALIIGGVSPSAAQTGPLTIQNGVFAVNGQKKFIQSVSYFGALRDAVLAPTTLISILEEMRIRGFNGVRVFGGWWWNDPGSQPGVCSTHFDPYPLVKGDGTINFDALSSKNGATPQPLPAPYSGYGYFNSVAGRLQFLLDVAWQKGFVVDLTFAAETVNGLWNINDPANSLTRFGNGLQSVAGALAGATSLIPGMPQTGYRHVFFDIQNEANYGVLCKPALTAQQVRTLRDRVKTGDSQRLVTASVAGELLVPDANTYLYGSNPSTLVDIVAYHEPRNPLGGLQWWQATGPHTNGIPGVYLGWRQVTNDTKPIYFGEPERHRYVQIANPNAMCATQWTATPVAGCRDNFTAAQFFSSAKAAKSSGAAAWLWHTEFFFRYQASYYPPTLPNAEQLIANSLRTELNSVAWPR